MAPEILVYLFLAWLCLGLSVITAGLNHVTAGADREDFPGIPALLFSFSALLAASAVPSFSSNTVSIRLQSAISLTAAFGAAVSLLIRSGKSIFKNFKPGRIFWFIFSAACLLLALLLFQEGGGEILYSSIIWGGSRSWCVFMAYSGLITLTALILCTVSVKKSYLRWIAGAGIFLFIAGIIFQHIYEAYLLSVLMPALISIISSLSGSFRQLELVRKNGYQIAPKEPSVEDMDLVPVPAGSSIEPSPVPEQESGLFVSKIHLILSELNTALLPVLEFYKTRDEFYSRLKAKEVEEIHTAETASQIYQEYRDKNRFFQIRWTEMKRGVQEIARESQGIADNINGMIERVGEGKTKIDSSLREMNLIRDSLSQVNRVIEIISGISDETNMLAMNAAIEAYHAGEKGRGFSIVADEIRDVATMSARESGQISTYIESILEKSAAQEEIAQEIRDIVADFSSHIERLFLFILNAIQTTKDLEHAVAALQLPPSYNIDNFQMLKVKPLGENDNTARAEIEAFQEELKSVEDKLKLLEEGLK